MVESSADDRGDDELLTKLGALRLSKRHPTDAGQQRLPGRRTAQNDTGPIPPPLERANTSISARHSWPLLLPSTHELKS
jgi:hypothetical protein